MHICYIKKRKFWSGKCCYVIVIVIVIVFLRKIDLSFKALFELLKFYQKEFYSVNVMRLNLLE